MTSRAGTCSDRVVTPPLHVIYYPDLTYLGNANFVIDFEHNSLSPSFSLLTKLTRQPLISWLWLHVLVRNGGRIDLKHGYIDTNVSIGVDQYLLGDTDTQVSERN